MNHARRFTSGDFALISSAPAPHVPQALVHRDVLGSKAVVDQEFSRDRRHLVRAVSLPSQVVSVTIGGLDIQQATRKHRHNYETIIYFMSGSGRSCVEDREIHWAAGDALYVPALAWHQHINCGDVPVRYVACENAPLLQNLGIAAREEGPDAPSA